MGSSQSSLANDSKFIDHGEGGRKSTLPALKRSSVSVMTQEHLDELTHSDTYHASFKSIVEVSDEESSVASTDSEFEDDEEWEERLRILEDARKLKEVAQFFLHPEAPVESSIGVTRCVFDRASAPERLSKEEADEQEAVLEEARLFKKAAVDFMHPELPISSDSTARARCYFSRPSAPISEDDEEREAILADMKALKEAAANYMHPERPVVSSPSACARSFFTRPSAIVIDEERDLILADAQKLKKLAVDYLHPENPVVVDDPTCTGRNYFMRPSADEQDFDADERSAVLDDVKALKSLATDYLHPERPVVTTDPTACGRNYFTRLSDDVPVDYDHDAHDDVMADVAAMKANAKQYFHPEEPVMSSAAGRNYFTRLSAPSFEDDERSQILADMKALKQAAADYLHPERPVVTSDPCACGRNYFTRPSAASYDDDEKAAIMEDLAQLKQAAKEYMHPELPVTGSACGRNYFTRPSAPEYEDEVDMDEKAQVLADMKAMKQLAVDYLHPEISVQATDPCVFGRNYYSRASAPETISQSDDEEAKLVLADMAALKQSADHFMHPEKPVVSSQNNCARSAFDRPDMSEQVDSELDQERELILAEAKALKQLAVDYKHPELSVVTSDPTACGRNFFDRPSHYLHDQNIHTFPPHDDDEEHQHEHMDHFGMDEDFFFSEFRNEMAEPVEKNKPKTVGSDVGSNLSRSPSSIMLFNEEYVE